MMSGIKKGADPDIFFADRIHRRSDWHDAHLRPSRSLTPERSASEARISTLCKHFGSHATRRIHGLTQPQELGLNLHGLVQTNPWLCQSEQSIGSAEERN